MVASYSAQVSDVVMPLVLQLLYPGHTCSWRPNMKPLANRVPINTRVETSKSGLNTLKRTFVLGWDSGS